MMIKKLFLLIMIITISYQASSHDEAFKKQNMNENSIVSLNSSQKMNCRAQNGFFYHLCINKDVGQQADTLNDINVCETLINDDVTIYTLRRYFEIGSGISYLSINNNNECTIAYPKIKWSHD